MARQRSAKVKCFIWKNLFNLPNNLIFTKALIFDKIKCHRFEKRTKTIHKVGIKMSVSRSVRRKKKKLRVMRLFVLLFVFCLIGGGSYFAYDILYNAKKASDSIFQELDPKKLPIIETKILK